MKNVIKEIKAYRTSDGAIFEDSNKAQAHQAELQFKAWYDEQAMNDLELCAQGYSVQAEDVLNWLRKNREEVLAFLSGPAA